MSIRQDQRVAEGATAIQSQRDTIVHQGLSSEDMRAIVESLADQMPKLVATAAAVMEVRLKSFEADIMKRFEEDAAVKKEAFADPDFQHVLLDAQRAYARTGDTETHGTLVDLIAKRSTEGTGTRRAFAMNEAITVVSRLTRSEISELALSFHARYTVNNGINNIPSFCSHINEFINDLINDVEIELQSYEYLVSQRCATISIREIGLAEIWRRVYPGLFMKGFTSDEVDGFAGEMSSDIRSLLVPSLFDPERFQPNAMTLEVFLGMLTNTALSKENLEQVWARAIANQPNDDEIIQKLTPTCPRIEELINKWHSSPMKSLDLTTIGKAIGHARLTQIPAFGKPDIGIWLK